MMLRDVKTSSTRRISELSGLDQVQGICDSYARNAREDGDGPNG